MTALPPRPTASDAQAQADSVPAVIGYYDASTGRGGTTRYLLELLQGLDRRRFAPVLFALEARSWHDDALTLDVPVITLQNTATAYPQNTAPQSISRSDSALRPAPPPPQKRGGIKRLVPPGIAWMLGQSRDCAALARLFRQRRVDLLHTNETGSELAPIAARMAGVRRIVGTWHVDSTYDLAGERQSAKYRLLEKLSMRALHAAIAVSEDTRRDWIRRCNLGPTYQARAEVIYNGIDVAEAREEVHREEVRRVMRAQFGFADEALLVGSLGRLAPAKGYSYLIEAFACLWPSYPSLQLALAGSGPEEPALRALVAQHGLQDRVRFLGFVEDTRALLACLDVYVQPSLCETLGIAILEACTLELPVVASRIGGIPEVVADGVTGRLVEARNPSALAAGLSELLSNPLRARQMGVEGRKRVSAHFTRADMVARTTDLYTRMLRTAL